MRHITATGYKTIAKAIRLTQWHRVEIEVGMKEDILPVADLLDQLALEFAKLDPKFSRGKFYSEIYKS